MEPIYETQPTEVCRVDGTGVEKYRTELPKSLSYRQSRKLWLALRMEMTEFTEHNQENRVGQINWLILLLVALFYPTILTLAYFQWLHAAPSGIQQTVYALGKIIQFGFPILFVLLARPNNLANRWFSQNQRLSGLAVNATDLNTSATSVGASLLLGVMFGVLVVAAMFMVYFFLLPSQVSERLSEMVQAKVTLMGVASRAKFLTLSLFYVIGHSFLEEYYWRWYVFNQLQNFFAGWKANLLAALGFMAHHVVLLGFFFGWDSPWTYFLSFSVAVGGVFWAWLFNRPHGFRSAWLSHAIVDAGIFALGIKILGI